MAVIGRDEQITTLQNLSNTLPYNWKPWLPASADAAFMCCIGAGPWKYPRRRNIQLLGLEKLDGRDIVGAVFGPSGHDTKASKALEIKVDWFPLKWQNEMTGSLALFLLQSGKRLGKPLTLTDFCAQAPFNDGWRKLFYEVCGNPKGTKVLSLFVRDFMGLPCFPVDRHVRRFLKEQGLPEEEHRLIDLCAQAGVDPVKLARAMGTAKLDGGNPLWHRWPDYPAPERADGKFPDES